MPSPKQQQNSTATYRGWIPTVGGGLSFDVFGKGRHPRRPSFANKSDDDARVILCSQTRFLADTPLLFRRLVTRLFGLNGNFTLVCIGMCPNNSRVREADLKGRVFIFKDKIWKDRALGLKNQFNSKKEKLNTYDRRRHGGLKAAFGDDYKELLNNFSVQSDFNADFTLKRSGAITLTIPRDHVTRHDAPKMGFDQPCPPTIAEKIVSLLSSVVELARRRFQVREEFRETRNVEKVRSDLRLEVCQQLFFFLKDVTHNHQHHDPYTDTMSLLYQVRNDDDEYYWRSDTLRNLYRMVLSFKRSQREEVFASALGILAYVKSFHRSCESELEEAGNKEFKKLQGLFPKLNDDLMGESISASQTVIRNEIQERIRMSERFQSILVSFLGAIFGMIGLLQINTVQDAVKNVQKGSVSNSLVWFGDLMIRQPFIVMFAAATIIFVAFFTANLKKVLQMPMLRKIFRSVYVIGVSSTSLVFILMSVAVGLGTVATYTAIAKLETKVLRKTPAVSAPQPKTAPALLQQDFRVPPPPEKKIMQK